jgi:hypothetical protein
MNRLRVLPALTTLVVVLVGSQWCSATPSFTLTSNPAQGEYEYGLTIDPNSHVRFLQNDAITLSGLSGVLAAQEPPPSGTAPSPPGPCVVPSIVPSGCRYGAPRH